MDRFDTDVLVVGTGPAGATAALALATYGVRVRAITQWNWLANTPRAHITNQRAMEILRDLGVEDEAKRVGTPWDKMGEMVFATSLAGEEVARLETWGAGERRHSDYRLASPCPLLDIPQTLMEPLLVNAAAARGATFSFNTEYLDHQQDTDGVTSRLKDKLSGHVYDVRSRFLLGADGANSRIVDQLGLPIVGKMGRAGTVYARFTADLSNYIAHRPGILHRILIPGYGEIGFRTLRAIRPWHDWIAGWGFNVDGPSPDLSVANALATIREMIGDPSVAVKVRDVTSWRVNQAYAERYSQGRVFCAGDAVHRHPPSSGLGSNTSMQDAFNLAWKLAYVTKGWAETELLSSYTEERAPVGRQVVERANQSRRDYAALNRLLLPGTGPGGGRAIDHVDDPTPEGAQIRGALVDAIAVKNYEFNAQGVELNHRYESIAVLPDRLLSPEASAGRPADLRAADQQTGDQPIADRDSLAAGVFEHPAVPRDPELYAERCSVPGAKVPHAWLVDARGRKLSTLDVVGDGMMTLVTGPSGVAWERAVERLDVPYLRSVRVGTAGLRDAYGTWRTVCGVSEAGALLVRPDGYIAWRHKSPVWVDDDAVERLHAALTSLRLGVSAVESAEGGVR